MASLWRDPRYVRLALRAAGQLSPHPGRIAAGILALWSCEQPSPAPWPPVHNNPGNLTRHVGALDGEPHHVSPTPPGRGLLYVYPSPEAGADAFAHYVGHSARYAVARAAAKAGNASAFVHALTSSGYGTNGRCAQDVLDRIISAPPEPEHHHYRCEAPTVMVRDEPRLAGKVVGRRHEGDIIAGHPVTGGGYVAGGVARHSWIKLRSGHYTAAAYYRRVS